MLHGSILQYFRPPLRYHLSLRSLFCLFLSSRFTQDLLYNFKMNVDLSIRRARIGLHRYILFKLKVFSYFTLFEFVTFLAMLLWQCGVVENNLGKDNSSNNDTSSQSSFPIFQGNFSVVHYNVQSLLHTLDIIESKKDDKDQESNQSSTTPEPGYHMGKWQKHN